MKSYMIQDNSTVEYEFLDKPVYYSPEFLSSLTGNVSCDVCDEHNGVKLTKTKNIFLKDNKLYAILEEELDTKNKGFSTRIRPLEFLVIKRVTVVLAVDDMRLTHAEFVIIVT